MLHRSFSYLLAVMGGVAGVFAGRWRSLTVRAEAGMSTVEYAVGTLAAVTFAGVLLKVVGGERVQAALAAIIDRALQ